ncbi:MAG: hypothetical protein IH604_14445 [Burkholderiales bacterium]|nr:hypothetical protein [Burkholderiales bacterium]
MAPRYIKAIIYLTVVIWTGVLYAYQEQVQSETLRHLSLVITIVLYVVMAFDLWVWKLPFLRGWFVKRPVIDGTWKVEIRSLWKDPATGAGIPPVEGYMVVRQTFSTLSMRLLTAESHSELVGTEIVFSMDGLYCVSGVYRNEPRLQVREKSPMHYGAVWLRVVGEPTQKITGHYWTDRQTIGEMDLTDRHVGRFQDFESAKAHYDNV